MGKIVRNNMTTEKNASFDLNLGKPTTTVTVIFFNSILQATHTSGLPHSVTNVGPGYPQEYGREDLYEYLEGLEPPTSMRGKRFLICKENKKK